MAGISIKRRNPTFTVSVELRPKQDLVSPASKEVQYETNASEQ
jgi:hypothetical protein